LNLNNDQTITGEINKHTTGYHALPQKKSYFSNADEHLKNYQDKYTNIEILNHNVENGNKNSAEFKEKFEIKYLSEDIGDNIYINPFLFKFFEENPFKLQERSYPTDFGYKDTYLYTLKININNYEIIEKPKDFSSKLPNNAGHLIFSSKIIDSSIVVYFKLKFDKAIYEPEFYPYLKRIMNQVVNIQQNSIIVLKRK
ncbi:MAG: hypothetical protein ACPG6B_06510, partial [Oceanihabitans sp.]